MRNFLILTLLFCITFSYSQEVGSKEFDFIIMVDGEIWETPTEPKMILKTKDSKNTISVSYHAGDLTIKSSDYQKILSEEVSSIILMLKYIDNEGDYYIYEINFKKSWLDNYFFILKIYNTNKKKYKKYYTPIEGKNYTYEYSSSNGQMLRVTKRKRKKCN